MATPYVGEIRMVGFNFPPVNWAFCDGSVISITQNETLFSLIGTTYGGNGQTTFALPNLLGRTPIHQGTDTHANQYVIGQYGGAETVMLNAAQTPAHTHSFSGTAADGTTAAPVTNCVPAAVTTDTEPIYAVATSYSAMTPTLLGGTGTPHNNLMPYLCVNFIISLYGVYPSQS